MSWLFTTIQHQPRLDLGLNVNEYCVLDLYYQTQNSAHNVDGWARNSYQQVSDFLGISKSTIHEMVGRLVNKGFMEVNPANSAQKRTTENWDTFAYKAVRPPNANSPAVRLPNDNRSATERHMVKVIENTNGRKESDFQKILNLPVTAEEIDLAFDAPENFQKSSAKKGFQRGGEAGLLPELQARVVAMKAELGGSVLAPNAKPAPSPTELEDATKSVMAEIETPDGQRKLKFAQGRAGIKKLPSNIFAAVARYVEHCSEKGYPLSDNPIYKLGGYLKYQATKEANQAETATLYKTKKTNSDATRFQPTDNPSQYDYSKINGW
jgi:DNA-binding Lrp family transcriptional regulator